MNSALKQRCGVGLGLVGVVHTRRWAVQRPRDDCTIGAMMVQRAARCGSPSGAVRVAVAVVEPCRPHSHGLRASNSLHGVLGRKLAGDGAVRGRLGAIQAAEPTVFRYCCARGMKIPPAAPAKKLQRFESLRLLWRRDTVGSGVKSLISNRADGCTISAPLCGCKVGGNWSAALWIPACARCAC